MAQHAQVQRALLQGGASVDAKDRKGQTALHAAALRGSTAALLALLRGGASVGAKDFEGVTVLYSAAFQGRVESVRALVQEGATLTFKQVRRVRACARGVCVCDTRR